MDDPATDPRLIESARKLFAGPCDFIAAADSLSILPGMGPIEIAFAGRSNVGKSSLINALTGRSTLARVSHTPGRTQALLFFNLGDRFRLVDMPGYGYANVSKAQSAAWNDLIKDYLRGRKTLRCVFLLLDARHDPKPADEDVMRLLDAAGVPFRVVLTKADTLKPDPLNARLEEVRGRLKKHPAAWPEVLATSSRKDMGIPALRATLLSLVS